MHLAFRTLVRGQRRGLLPALFACGFMLAGLSTTAFAQTFVAEWAQEDVGRLGPTGMAVDTIGSAKYLYVADQRGGRIFKIDLNTGSRVALWGKTGNGRLEFNSPYGIAIEPSTHDLYIAERGNSRVHRITSNGEFVMGWGEPGRGPGQFAAPIGIAADASGNVYVVDHENDRVQKFNVRQTSSGWDAQFIREWGGTGSGNGQFNNPYGLALDPAGNVWVADGSNHRLQKFDKDGNFLATFGTHGTGNGQFITPVWMFFEPDGSFYVTDTNSDPANPSAPDLAHQRVQKFNADGSFAVKWGSYGEAGGQFQLPMQAVSDGAGNVYVSDYYNTRVQKFTFNPVTDPGPGPGNGSQFVNVSSRLRTSADKPLIAGFVIKGSGPKQILIRAVGPTLAQLSVTGALSNPRLQVYAGQTVLTENDDWTGTGVADAASRLGAFALPAGSADAALLLTVEPGVYSAQVGASGGDGIALIEVYDADGKSSPRVVNISSRGFVRTGDGVLIAGFVIQGTTPKRVLIRGVGPTLAVLGVGDSLANPGLRVYNSGSALIAENDDWGVTNAVPGGPALGTAAETAAAAKATGAFDLPSDSKDAAMLVTLQPGAYSAMVSGANDSTGTALVEVYEVP